MNATSGPLGIDWSSVDAPVDPYLIWADVTGFRGLGVCRDMLKVGHVRIPFATAVHRSALAKPPHIRETRQDIDGTCYAALRLSPRQIRKLIRAGARLELGLPNRVPGGGLANLTTAVRSPDDQAASSAVRPSRLKGHVMAVIDDGCAFAHENFRTWDRDRACWHTRVTYLWDQESTVRHDAPWQPVPGFRYGRELRQTEIDALLASHSHGSQVDEDAVYQAAHYDKVANDLSHGTHVTDLAAGTSAHRPADVAGACHIIFVQLPRAAVADTAGASMVVHVLDALRYIVSRVDAQADVVVNLSYGSAAGPHDGRTLLEQAMDAIIAEEQARRRCFHVVLPAGNGYEENGHARLNLSRRTDRQTLSWHVMADDPTDSYVELWYANNRGTTVGVTLRSPDGQIVVADVPADSTAVPDGSSPGDPVCAVIHRRQGLCTPDRSVVLIAVAPTRAVVTRRQEAPYGVWTIEVTASFDNGAAKPLTVDAWIERDDATIGSVWAARQSRFVSRRRLDERSVDDKKDPVKREGTGSSIANGQHTIVVGGCFASDDKDLPAYTAAASLRLPAARRKEGWPDVLAPSEESPTVWGIAAAGNRSGLVVRMNGTSVAAPQVARRILDMFVRSAQGDGKRKPKPGGEDGASNKQRLLQAMGVVAVNSGDPARTKARRGARRLQKMETKDSRQP